MSWTNPWWEDLFALWDYLVTLVKTVKIPDATSQPLGTPTPGLKFGENGVNVFYGEKFTPENYPSCYVCWCPSPMVPFTFQMTLQSYIFEFGVVNNNPDVRQCIIDASVLVGLIYDALVVDRKQTGKVDFTEGVEVIPNWRNLGIGLENSWVGLRVHFRKFRR